MPHIKCKGSSKGIIAIKKIAAEAKRIRKSHPNMQQKTAISQAAVKYRAGKL